MNNLKKSSLIALITIGCLVAFTGAASANSITLSKSGGTPGPSSYSISDTFTVTVFANLTPTGGGLEAVNMSLSYNSAQFTAVACAEEPGLQSVAGTFYAPFIPLCGPGSPGDGGVVVAGLVRQIEQANAFGGGAVSGVLVLGTVTFHATFPGSSSITAFFESGIGGFLGADFVNRTAGIPLQALAVTVVPEPTTLALLGLGVLGLGLSGRRLRRR